MKNTFRMPRHSYIIHFVVAVLCNRIHVKCAVVYNTIVCIINGYYVCMIQKLFSNIFRPFIEYICKTYWHITNSSFVFFVLIALQIGASSPIINSSYFFIFLFSSLHWCSCHTLFVVRPFGRRLNAWKTNR